MADYFLRDVPDELLKEFKSACALKGTSMKDRIIELMRRDVVSAAKEKDLNVRREDVKKWLKGAKKK